MKKYKITYWLSGNICVCETESESAEKARYWFDMFIPNDDIISLVEVAE